MMGEQEVEFLYGVVIFVWVYLMDGWLGDGMVDTRDVEEERAQRPVSAVDMCLFKMICFSAMFVVYSCLLANH